MACWKCRAQLILICYPGRPLPVIYLACPNGCGRVPARPVFTSN